MSNILHQISMSLLKGNTEEVLGNIKSGLEKGIKPEVLLNDGLLGGIDIVGEKFKNQEYFIPEVMLSTRAMHAGLEILKPMLKKDGVKPTGKVIIGTVKGDLHDIGKNLVKIMLESVGFQVFDLGIDIAADKFVSYVNQIHPDIVGMSSLLTTTMYEMKNTIDALEEAGLREELIIMVGGAPVTATFASEIGADLYAKDAVEASILAKEKVLEKEEPCR